MGIQTKSLDEIKEMMTEAGLPIPLIWIERKLFANVENNSTEMVIYGEKLNEDEEETEGTESTKKKSKKRKRKKKDDTYMDEDEYMSSKKLGSEVLVRNQSIRIQYPADSRGDSMVKSYEECSAPYQGPLQRQPIGILNVYMPWEYNSSKRGVPIYIQAEMNRKEKYADLLLAHKNAEKAAAYQRDGHKGEMHT